MEKKTKLNVAGAAAFDNILNSMARTEAKPPEIEKPAVSVQNPPAVEQKEVVGEEPTEEANKVAVPEPAKPQKDNQPAANNDSTTEFSKKELEVMKKYLSERKGKGKTAPVMVEIPLKNILEEVSRYMGISMTAFVGNIVEENIRENKKIYLDLMNRKKPSISL